MITINTLSLKPITAALLLTSSLCLPLAAQGSEVGPKIAESVVAGWLRLNHAHLGQRFNAKISSVETFKDSSGSILYHAVELDPSGFVIVPGDDSIEPIIAFSSRGRFINNITNSLSALVAYDVPKRVLAARAASATKLTGHFLGANRKWRALEQLSAGGTTPSLLSTGHSTVSDLRVPPLTRTLWNQYTSGTGDACYNYYTPPYTPGASSNYVCGCVATAMAQVMYYFKYPTFDIGTPSFTISVDGVSIYTTLRGGDGHGGPYDWDNMPLNGDNPSLLERQAVGALTFDSGVSINMSYTRPVSTASFYAAKNALHNTFKFSNAVYGSSSGGLTLSQLIPMINPNLDAHLPVILGIEPDGGHCVVCDGYGYDLSTLYDHLNLGWGGYDNAWYALPDVNVTNAGYHFTTVLGCIYNIYDGGSGEIISGRIVTGSDIPLSGASVSAAHLGGQTYVTTTDANGIYALTKLPSFGHYTLTISKRGFGSAITNLLTGTSSDLSTTSGNVWGVDITLNPVAGPPFIIAQPQSRMQYQGGSVTFTATAIGNPSPSYQWKFNGTNISGATSSSYTISSVSTNNAGDYSVVASNSAGSTGSDTAELIVLTTQAILTDPVVTNNTIKLTVSELSGLRYVVQASTNLTTTNWVSIATNTAPFTVTDSTFSSPSNRFYRALYLP